MTQKQKETILLLLRKQEEERKYAERYLISYEEFLDAADEFTDFCCERAEGKRRYADMIGEIIKQDVNAKIFVQIYGFEEEKDGSDIFIYAETLILLTELRNEQVQEVIDMSGDIFPSEFGEEKQESSNWDREFVMDAEGRMFPIVQYLQEKQRMLFFWWD